jgi:hypothetical protein
MGNGIEPIRVIPIREISQEAHTRSARMKFKIKGHQEGPIYEGQKKIWTCKSCGN